MIDAMKYTKKRVTYIKILLQPIVVAQTRSFLETDGPGRKTTTSRMEGEQIQTTPYCM